jgi:hypothetical protein
MIASLNNDYRGTYVVTEENPRTLSISGATVASIKAIIDADLSSRTYDPGKEYRFLINLGINDGAATESQFKLDYLYIIDALKVKFPNAEMYLTYPAARNREELIIKLASWISDIVAARSTFVHDGDNEAIWFENGDNYTALSNNNDGLHRNTTTGQDAEIAAKRAAIGY